MPAGPPMAAESILVTLLPLFQPLRYFPTYLPLLACLPHLVYCHLCIYLYSIIFLSSIVYQGRMK